MPVMDTYLAARFPFIKDASEFADSNMREITELLDSGTYAEARERGMARVLGALEDHRIPDGKTLFGNGGKYNRLIEVLSYPYARMVVSEVNDRFLTRRYALAEAEKMNDLLYSKNNNQVTPDRAAILTVGDELEVNARRVDDDHVSMHFADYLRYSYVMKASEWKLINMDIREGYVRLTNRNYTRLLQNAYRLKIERELPLQIPPEFKNSLSKNVEKVSAKLAEAKKRMSPTGGEAVKDEFLPPCIRAIISQAQVGQNLSHSARFALVSYLNALGMDYDQIVAVFAESPDFDEAMSRYQIQHITGELNGTDGYTPPECGTMKTNGICYEPDDICERIHHPLQYYRIRSGRMGSPKRRKPFRNRSFFSASPRFLQVMMTLWTAVRFPRMAK